VAKNSRNASTIGKVATIAIVLSQSASKRPICASAAFSQ
jgi:hypothetical protein